MNEVQRRLLLHEKIKQFAYELQAAHFPAAMKGACWAGLPDYIIENQIGDRLMKILESDPTEPLEKEDQRRYI